MHYNSNVRCKWRGVSNQSMQTDPGKELDVFAELLYCPESLPQPDTADSLVGAPAASLSNPPLRLDLAATQPYLSPLMRAVLMDWLMDVCACYGFRRDTYYLSVLTADRYLSVMPNLPKNQYQLLGLASLYLACKAEEITIRRIDDFVKAAGHSYPATAITHMERCVLRALQWRIYLPCPNALLYQLAWEWDQYVTSAPREIETLLCPERCLVLLHQLDIVYMDIEATGFPEGHLPLGILFLHLCSVVEYSILESEFPGFLSTIGLEISIEDLYPVLEFLSIYHDLPMPSTSPTSLLLQPHSDLTLPYLRSKLPPNLSY